MRNITITTAKSATYLENVGLYVCAANLSGCAGQEYYGYQDDFYKFSSKLNEGMNEQAVINALGYSPQDVQLLTCGSETPAPWQCKVYHYHRDGYPVDHDLNIFFSKSHDGSWVVSGWHYR